MPGIEITTVIGCKNYCVYCPQGKLIAAYIKRSKIIQMNFGVFKTCIDKIPLNVIIHFTGMSEPWLNPECTKMILYAHKRGYKIVVATTLVGMSLSDIDLIESIPFEGFWVHLPSDEGYEKIRVDKNYLKLLNKLSESNIKVKYHFHGKNPHPKVKLLIKKDISWISLLTRAGNKKIKNSFIPKRKRGVIGCRMNLCRNILLPNGDVTLCCMDYGMQHILGNLLSSDYGSLFCGKEFLKIKKGLKDESLDILCRYCDKLAYDVSLFAKVYNNCCPTNLFVKFYNNYLPYLKNIRNLKDFLQLIQKASKKFV